MYLMCNTLNTMQHPAFRESHLIGSTLPHTATNCNTLQTLQHVSCTKKHLVGHTLQNIATRCITLQHIATHFSKLRQLSFTREHIVSTTHCDALQHTTTHWNTLQHTAAHRKHCINWNTLQHVALHILPQAEAQRNTLLHATLDEFYKGAQRGTTL